MNICVLGAGTWGTALASLLAKNGHRTTLWSAIPEELHRLSMFRAHPNLPGASIPDNIIYHTDISKACRGNDLILFVVASQFVRSTARAVAPCLQDGVLLVSAAKGIEKNTLMTMSDIIHDEVGRARPDLSYKVAAISGPTHAEEVALGLPTSIVAACEDEPAAFSIAELFAGSCVRAYTNTDTRGVELAGAIKNVIAIAAGINRGMGFGDNAQAMLMTRGAAEMARIGLAMGCKRRTFMGLAGIGDLIVTCTSRHSRNNQCGQLLAAGIPYEEAARKIGMVVEGYHALEGAMALKQKYGVDMPITEAVYDIIFRHVAPKDAIAKLMARDIKSELNT